MMENSIINIPYGTNVRYSYSVMNKNDIPHNSSSLSFATLTGGEDIGERIYSEGKPRKRRNGRE